jgi:DNA polymerase/3'-5' exonuclease PolX
MSSVTATSFDGNTEKIFQVIKKFGKIKHTSLLQKCWRYASAEDLGNIMKTLVEAGEIHQFMDDKNARWYQRKE